MSNTYSDATGVLLFDGPSRITPVIRMLFAPFKLEEEPEPPGTEHYVAVLAEDNHYDWDRYVDALIEAAENAFGIEFSAESTPDQAVRSIAAHFGVDAGELIESIDFDNTVLLSDLVALALLLQDGHNLVGLNLEGCWHLLALSTADISAFARTMDAGAGQGAAATAQALKAFVTTLAEGILDARLRKEVLVQLVDQLTPLPASAMADEPDGPPAWSRIVYVEAHATDEGSGPSYARLDVTPHFIARLKALRALCTERELTEVRVTDAPSAWGPGTSEEDLRLQAPELAVTPRMFWFTDHPKGLPIDIETRGTDIERFIYEVSGAGEPVYLGVTPEDVEDEQPPAT